MPSVNGGQVVKFPKDTSTCPISLSENLRIAIQLNLDNPNAEREITSLWCGGSKEYKGICVYKAQFTQEMIDDIKAELDHEFDITIKFTKCNGRTAKDYFRFSSISW